MPPGIAAAVLLLLFFLLLGFRVPVAFALGLASVPLIILTPGLSFYIMLDRLYSSFDSFLLLAVPFFLLAANIMNDGGLTERLFRFSRAMVGHYRGALAQINVVLSFLFAGISGSATADAAAQSEIFLPQMAKEGYDPNFSVANTAVGSTLACIIPPSIIMVIWAGTMSISIGKLYVAGIVPGALIALGLMTIVAVYARRKNLQRFERSTLRNLVLCFLVAIPALFLPFIIAGGKIFGWFTATESAAVATVYAIVIALVLYRGMTVRRLAEVFLDSARFAAMTLFCLGTASIFGWLLAYFRVPEALLSFAAVLNLGTFGTGVFIFVVFLIVGCFLDAIPAIVIVGTILAPVAAEGGLAPLQFALIGIISLSIGLVTPPYGLSLLIASHIGRIKVVNAVPFMLLFIMPFIVTILLIAAVPEPFLWLTNFVD